MWNLHSLGVTALITLALTAGSAWYGYSKGKQSGMQQVQILWDSEKLVMTEMLQQQAMLSLERQQKINQLAAQARRTQREAQTRIAALERELSDSLLDRPEGRAGFGGVPEATDVGTGCTGAGLARPDASFLAGFAADAARLQAALDACKAGYRLIGGEVIE